MGVVVKLTKESHRAEGVAFEDDKTWHSPSDGGGWLKAQSGVWESVGTSGTRMYDDKKKENIGYLVLFFPRTSKKGDTGRFIDEGNGDEGRWEVTAV